MVDELNGNFEGVIARLDYLVALGVNAIEFMPLTNVPEPYRWGYHPGQGDPDIRECPTRYFT